MKFIRCFTLLLLLIPALSSAQKKLTLEDASGFNRDLYPATLENLQWIGASDAFSWIGNNALVSRKATSTVSDTILTLHDFNQHLKRSGMDTLRRFPPVKWRSAGYFTFGVKNGLFGYALASGDIDTINTYPEEAQNIDYAPVDGMIAYTVGNNLFIARDGRQIPVTRDGDKALVSGQTVHRNEFGIKKGTFWSPAGKHLAYYRKDESMVTEYPLLNTDERIATVENIRYPMAGMTSEQVTLVVYHTADSTYTTIRTEGPPDQYLTCVTWGPDEKEIYTAILNRDQNHLWLNCYDALSGELVKTLFEEEDPEYVEPLFPLYFLESDPSRFLWFSERDGYQHLYLYNTDGQLLRQLTRGPWVVTELAGISPRGSRAFFLATRNSPLNRDLFSVDLENGKITPLSLAQGTHRSIMDGNGKYFIDIYSDTTTCQEYSVMDVRGRVHQVFHSSDNPLHDYKTGQLKIFKLKAEDGTDLYCSMILPPDFDPAKKYPVIDYVYGGPHIQLVTNSWLGGFRLFMYYMADRGYIIFTLDNRGSDNRGLDFEQAVFRHLGSLETADQMVGIQYLKQMPWVDPSRVGVHGWSYGGFMTIYMMLKHPDVFKTGVCGGPVCDWKYYEVMYGERYMDTPEQNPEGYAEASLLNQAGNLKGDLLVIHGADDGTVVWQNSLQLMKRFVEEGRQADYFVYPEHGHGVTKHDRIHLNRKIEKYFLDHL